MMRLAMMTMIAVMVIKDSTDSHGQSDHGPLSKKSES